MIYFYTSLITYFIYTILKYKESLILLQKNNYDSKKYKSISKSTKKSQNVSNTKKSKK